MNDSLLIGTFRRYAGKMIANTLMVFCSLVINGIAISRWLGTEAMAAFQVTQPLFFAVMVFSLILSIGLQANCAKCLGMGKSEEAGAYYSTALLTSFPVGLLLAAGVASFADSVALFLCAGNSAGTIAAQAADYLRGMAWQIPFMLLAPAQFGSLVLEGRSKVAMEAIWVLLAVNILAVATNLMLFSGGMFGMGLAVSLSQGASFLYIMAARRKGSGSIRFRYRSFSMERLWPILRIGFPSAVDRFYKTVQLFVVNRVLLLKAEAVAVAAFADINALNNVFNPIIIGVGEATLAMAGVFAGERDRHSINRLFRMSVSHGFCVMAGTAALAFLAAPFLIRLFVSEGGEAYDVAVLALRVYVLYLPAYGINQVLQKYYIGVNSMKMTYLSSVLDNVLFICPLAILLGNLFGAEGVWAAFPLAEVLTLLATALAVALLRGKMPRQSEDFLCLPQGFGEEACFSKSARSMEEVVCASEEARQFLLSQGASPREANLMALAVEEMGGNIIRWGFGDGKPHSIDLRIVKEEAWAMRIRDDCAPFDPQEWLKLHQGGDPMKNIGIRTICAMAKDVRHANTLGLNYLFIRV